MYLQKAMRFRFSTQFYVEKFYVENFLTPDSPPGRRPLWAGGCLLIPDFL